MTFEERVSAPSEPIITLEQAKAQLRVDHSDDDTLIGTLLEAASSTIEEMSGRALVEQTWKQSEPGPAYDDYYLSWRKPGFEYDVHLMRPPVASLEKVEFYDSENALQEASLSDFRLYGDGDRSFVRPQPDSVWPSLFDRPDALQITYKTGYGTADDVPQPLKAAALMLVAHWYERAEAVTEGVSAMETPLGVRHLVDIYRVGWVFG